MEYGELTGNNTHLLFTPPGSILGKQQGLKPVALKLDFASESHLEGL